ncbi:radical SAM family heme chaperone HemW [Sandaracinobacter sp. RS1-74]|uniref:radical SAM family heme chaperone HemW n=1 Tax=Sandaracinobacteroides sayramensis TaxID=2913411 RepID=UPI001EDBB803|nr:radical SAM family heme chaperone HemW [Sandaracinobacteroides sayramensis]MCG2839653.1 radical SAM family heme chaperone HemW [Sandaracinobacteroides sayramensis]
MSGDIALYVHWPFCVTKCPYCDFNSHVRERVDQSRWRDALLADLRHEAALTGGQKLVSIFFGGGTPSLMEPATAEALIAEALRLWPAAADPEITLEANPSSVEAARFADFAAAGVNRVSLGLQALDDAALKLLGRPHDLAQGLAALDTAQAHFPRVSFDLIHTRPGQTSVEWETELARALSFGTEHLSAYQLTIEPGTRFHTLAAKGLLTLPDEEEAATMFDLTGELCAAAGLPLYEISNHARPGAESRHNLQYWTYGDYAGIGPGAHGRRGGLATTRIRRPESWLEAVSARGHGLEAEEAIDRSAAAEEALLMGLRLVRGIEPAHFEARTGLPLDSVAEPQARARLQAMGLLEPGLRLRTTEAGRPLTNRLLVELVSGLESAAGHAK